jgi:threonine synthase
MEAITEARPALPPRLASLMSEPERFEVLPNDAAAVAAYVESHARAVGEVAP